MNRERCDGSGWLVDYEAAERDEIYDRRSCPGCDACPENADLMDRLEAAEGRFVSAICDGDEPDEEDVELLTRGSG